MVTYLFIQVKAIKSRSQVVPQIACSYYITLLNCKGRISFHTNCSVITSPDSSKVQKHWVGLKHPCHFNPFLSCTKKAPQSPPEVFCESAYCLETLLACLFHVQMTKVSLKMNSYLQAYCKTIMYKRVIELSLTSSIAVWCPAATTKDKLSAAYHLLCREGDWCNPP